MDYQEIIEKIKPELNKAIDYLKEEIAEIRTSRPSISLVESLEVHYLDKQYPLKSLALLSLSEGRNIIIQPWDSSYIESIQKAIRNSSLHLSPIVEGKRIRISFPPMTGDLRERLVRLLSEKGENVSQTIRHWRGVAKREVDKKFSNSEIGEDDKFKAREALDELASEYNDKIDEIIKRKREEILN